MDGADVWPWVQALHLIGTIVLGGFVWAFTAGARLRSIDQPPQASHDTTRTTALSEAIEREVDRYEQRRPKADAARVDALEGAVKTVQSEMRDKHAFWREQHQDAMDAVNAALRTTGRLEERVDATGKRTDDLTRRMDQLDGRVART